MRVVLKVRHEGTPKMVGKVFHTPENGLICLHESKTSQFHRNLNSPGGVDSVALEWLGVNAVREFHHFCKESRTLYQATIEDIQRFGVPQTSGGRTRIYLALPVWRQLIQIERLPYAVPWIRDESVIGECATNAWATATQMEML